MQGQFVPWLYAIGSRIRPTSLRKMAEDASAMATAVVESGKLFGSAALCLNFDPTLWAEAAGCTIDWDANTPAIVPGGSSDPNPDAVRTCARITTLINAAERVKGTLPNQPLMCAVVGPATIARFLELSQPVSRMDQFTVSELLTEYVNVLCEHKVDHIVIVEDQQLDDQALAPWVEGKQYSRIAKLANHYAAETTLLCPQVTLNTAQLGEFDSLTQVAAPADKLVEAELTHAVKGILVQGFGTGSATLPHGLDRLERGSYFLTTPWDLDPASDFDNIQKDLTAISSFLQPQ